MPEKACTAPYPQSAGLRYSRPQVDFLLSVRCGVSAGISHGGGVTVPGPYHWDSSFTAHSKTALYKPRLNGLCAHAFALQQASWQCGRVEDGKDPSRRMEGVSWQTGRA